MLPSNIVFSFTRLKYFLLGIYIFLFLLPLQIVLTQLSVVSLPINIVNIINHFDISVNELVIPTDKPTVPNAETVSNANAKSLYLFQ